MDGCQCLAALPMFRIDAIALSFRSAKDPNRVASTEYSTLFLCLFPYLALSPQWSRFHSIPDSYLCGNLLLLSREICFHWILVGTHIDQTSTGYSDKHLIPFFRSNRNCLFGYLAGVLLCTLGSILLLGNHGFSQLLELFGELKDHQSAYEAHYAQMANLTGVFYRHPLGIGDNIRMLVSVILWILSVGWIGLSSYRFKQKEGAGASCNQMFFDCRLVIISTLVSIHMNGHDFILFLAPILIILGNAKYRFEIRTGSRTHLSTLILTALFSVALLTPLCWAVYIFLPDALVAVQILLLIGSIRLPSDLQSSSRHCSGFQVPG